MEQVTQADREAAFDSDTKMAVTTKRAEVLAGEWDNDPLVQAFARHRIEATQAKDEEIARLASLANSAAARACYNSDHAPEQPDRYYLAEEVRKAVYDAIIAEASNA